MRSWTDGALGRDMSTPIGRYRMQEELAIDMQDVPIELRSAAKSDYELQGMIDSVRRELRGYGG